MRGEWEGEGGGAVNGGPCPPPLLDRFVEGGGFRSELSFLIELCS